MLSCWCYQAGASELPESKARKWLKVYMQLPFLSTEAFYQPSVHSRAGCMSCSYSVSVSLCVYICPPAHVLAKVTVDSTCVTDYTEVQ